MTTLPGSERAPRPPVLDARLAAAAAWVRPGQVAADIGCDHGKLAAWLAATGHCPRVLACDLRPGPLQKARRTCAPWADRVELRLGDGLAPVAPGEAGDIIIAGMGAETICQILAAAPWTADARCQLVLVPATKHGLLRRWLAQNGFALRGETLCRAAGRWYTALCAVYDGRRWEPDGLWCVCGALRGQPGAAAYRDWELSKVKKTRRGLGDGPAAAAVDVLIRQLEADQWP